MNERGFSAQFRSDINKFKTWFGDDIHNRLIPDTYRGGKRPYDSYLVYDGLFVALEFKMVKGASITKEILQSHQETSLDEVNKCKGMGLIVVCVQRLKKVFVFQLDEWRQMFKIRGRLVKIDVLNSFNLKRIKTKCGTIWDIEAFQDYLIDSEYHR